MGPVPYPSAALPVLPAVRSGAPQIYGGRVLFPSNLLTVSIWEMGGSLAVLPPCITLLAVAELLPRNCLLLKGGVPETRNHPPFPKSA